MLLYGPGGVTWIDAVSGATYSSNAIKENVKRGLSYYRKHKK